MKYLRPATKNLATLLALLGLMAGFSFAQDTGGESTSSAVQEPTRQEAEDQNTPGEKSTVENATDEEQHSQVDHWADIQTRRATAQGICPMMDKEITTDSETVLVGSQRVFVCCKCCAAGAPGNADEVLEKVNTAYTAFVAVEAIERSVAARIAALAAD